MAVGEFLGTNREEFSNLVNLERLNYAVDLLAAEMNRREKGLADIYSDEVDIDLVTSNAFISYVKFHRQVLIDNFEGLKDLENELEKKDGMKAVDVFFNTVKELPRKAQDMIKDQVDPKNINYREEAKKDVQNIMNPSDE